MHLIFQLFKPQNGFVTGSSSIFPVVEAMLERPWRLANKHRICYEGSVSNLEKKVFVEDKDEYREVGNGERHEAQHGKFRCL